MENRQEARVLRIIRDMAARLGDDQTSDRDLLCRFVKDRNEDAFAALVRRHGSMVMGVGLRTLRHYQDAEDVCQATFLLLAKKADATVWRDSVANWLYEVAYHLALKAKRATVRRMHARVKSIPNRRPMPWRTSPPGTCKESSTKSCRVFPRNIGRRSFCVAWKAKPGTRRRGFLAFRSPRSVADWNQDAKNCAVGLSDAAWRFRWRLPASRSFQRLPPQCRSG